MVQLCSYQYPKERESAYSEYYKSYSYELHDFQKWCVEAIVTGNHVLVCCPTGSGKTFGGEFAIQHLHSRGKKVIYTCPIKALSNEKFYAFTQKYPHISVGIVTGDVKCNPDADCIIMTTEILLNKLYQLKGATSGSYNAFEIDLERELGCVVFDEIHFIADESRGHAWEESIMLLPPHVQMVGLSATLDDPVKFAHWLETKGNRTTEPPPSKEVYLTRKQVRAVPLIHYGFITASQTVFKTIRDKTVQDEIKHTINEPLVLQDEKGAFHDAHYKQLTKTLDLFEQHDIRIKRQHVLNKVTEYLVEKEMLPALCYVFSRKQLEKCADELTTNLLEFDSKVPYTVDRECEQIIRKLPNYEEYLHLPEYVHTVQLLRKGVGVHHAGLMPILREMTELLFARGFIKVLFCTETMSVGINLPVKTTIFTDVCKFTDGMVRTLYGHEYTQAAGRAGRLGLDKVGHVIHLNNLFRDVESVNYKTMMKGKPQSLTSKFKLSYNLLLNLLQIGDLRLMERSMVTDELHSQTNALEQRITELQEQPALVARTPLETIETYLALQTSRPNAVNKKRKDIDRQLQQILDTYKFIEQDSKSYQALVAKEKEKQELLQEREDLRTYFASGTQRVLSVLQEQGFVDADGCTLTLLGKVASQIRETHCLAFAQLHMQGFFSALTSRQLVALFSCFTNIRVSEERRDIVPKSDDPSVNESVDKVLAMYHRFQDMEIERNVGTSFEYDLQYDLLPYTEWWCDAESVEDSKHVLESMASTKEIFLGEFVKAMLKVNNVASELETVAEMTRDVSLLSKLREIPHMTLKYVVTNQSLYI